MILDASKSYTFSEIFELNASTVDILAELGYTYQTVQLALKRYPIPKEAVDQLQAKFYRRLPHIVFTSETSRREFIVSDILSELIDHIQLQIETEYTTANKRLRGNIDYLLRGSHQLLVIEAKNDEMERGFRQLAVELIATADQLKLNELYGAVTTGEFWRFGLFDRQQQIITRDLNAFAVPAGLHALLETLAGLTAS